MSTSEFECRILTDAADYGLSTNPLDVATSRYVINNLNHLSDEFGQVLSCMSSTVAALSGKTGYLTPATPAATGVFYPVVSHTFPIKVRAAGQSYKFRIRIGGASGNTASTLFLAQLTGGSGLLTSGTDAQYVTAATTSSTAAWLTGASLGPNAYTTLMELTSEQVNRCLISMPTTIDLGGDDASVQVAMVTLLISASTANVAHVPRLYNVMLAEVIGTS